MLSRKREPHLWRSKAQPGGEEGDREGQGEIPRAFVSSSKGIWHFTLEATGAITGFFWVG